MTSICSRALIVLGLLHLESARADTPRPIKILFLGDNGHHEPKLRYRQFLPSWTARGIEVTYTDKVTALNPQLLANYDGLIIYANTTAIAPDQEQALLDFVAG